MSQIMKSFLGVFLILILVAVTAGILGAFLTVLSAQNMHSQIICELEDSGFDGDVIKSSFNIAEEAGYNLELVLYYENNTSSVCKSADSVPGDCSSINGAKVELTFNFNVAFFQINSRHVLCGFAR